MLKEVQSDPEKITASQLHTLHENIENKLKKEETKSKVDLAVYLTGKLTIGEEVDNKLLDDLKKANDSVNKTRAQLFHGQGNVTTNKYHLHQSCCNTQSGTAVTQSQWR
ncbi:hypothetical protein [Vibrio azureus]|nr:hypothetical protein [Vibrio azureus]